MCYLKIENLQKSFGSTQVLKDINIELNKGEVLTLIGSSGSGKTTLLRIINFLETPDSGKMTLEGEVLFDGNLKGEKESKLIKKRLNFGLVFQNFNLFPQYTALKNVTLANELLLKDKIKEYKRELKQKSGDNGLIGRDIKSLVKEKEANLKQEIITQGKLLLEKVGLKDKMDLYPHQLSGGQKQRVAIARALSLKPKILCFDEPTSALDPELTGEVLKVINELKVDSNMTMIIVTHEMEFAKKISDQVVFMSNGVVIENGPPKVLFENPKNQLTKQFIQGYNLVD